MVNEHYVQESYLRLFSPGDQGVISRYSLVEKHGGGDYYDPIDRFSVGKAASSENYADGFLEGDETNRAENAMVKALRKVIDDRNLSKKDIAHLSQFIVFQRDRSPRAKTFHRLKEKISQTAGIPIRGDWESVIELDAGERHEGLQFMGWKIIENETSLPFFTSDGPVVIYQEEFPGDGLNEGFQFTGKEVFCPVNPDKLLLLLDPNTFEVEPQYPSTFIPRVKLDEIEEIWKFNLLQGLSAFHEVFGPVGFGEELERMIEVMCIHFPDEDYIRGTRWDTERILDAQRSGFREATFRPEQLTIPPEDREIITASKKASDARWLLNHGISLIDELRREEPIDEYW